MAYTTINSLTIAVGQPIKAETFALIKSNEDDLDSRISALAASSSSIEIVNEEIFVGNLTFASTINLIFREAISAYNVTEVAIQLFAKSPATTGSLTVDVKKGTSTNPASFATIMTTPPTLNIATAVNYQRAVGVINSSSQNFALGNILRVDLTALPANLNSFRIVIKGTP
jgi:hypothetical protein